MTSREVIIDESELISALKHDCVAILGFYLQDELDLEVPKFHLQIWKELVGMLQLCNRKGVATALKKLFAVPREHSKSTLAKVATILFLKYTPYKFVLYASKTNGIARNAIHDILAWLESPQETALHGPMIRLKSSETDSLWIIEMGVKLKAGEEPVRKRCIFKALGAGQQIRGMLIHNTRPQIIIVDDIEDLDNTSSESQQTKLDEWFMGSFLKSFSSRGNITIFIGNMIRKTTLLARLSKNPKWNPTVFGCIVKEPVTGEYVPLWEGKDTLEAHLEEYKEFRLIGTGHVWEAEMMNLTQEDIYEKDLSKLALFATPIAEEIERGFIVLDPAYGQKSWHDDSAITVHAILKGSTLPVVIDRKLGKWPEEELMDQLLDMTYKWGLSCWCIEADAAQKLLMPLFKLYMTQRYMNADSITMIPVYTHKKAKASRILAFRSAALSGSYGVGEDLTDVVDDLVAYTPEDTKKDDLLDSCAYGPTTWELHGDTIRTRGEVSRVDFNSLSGRSHNELPVLQGSAVDGF